MDDPSFLTGRSTYALKRRREKLGICKCGTMFAEHPKNCRKQAISDHKLKRLEWVSKGRVTSSETLYPLFNFWVGNAYGLCEHTFEVLNKCYCINCLCDRIDLLEC
nr:MAG: RNA-binding protein [Actinidia virus A]